MAGHKLTLEFNMLNGMALIRTWLALLFQQQPAGKVVSEVRSIYYELVYVNVTDVKEVRL